MSKPNFATGSYTGTGAAINISCGFKPDWVRLINFSDAGALYPTLEWCAGMAAASGIKTLKVVDSGATGNASSNLITVNGISMYAGDTTHSPGFTIGADADLNVNTEVGCWVAGRSM